MSQFDEVDLGFAEFVSNLIEETFDATLSAQQHQHEKYAEMISSLALDDLDFYEECIANSDAEEGLSELEKIELAKLRKTLLNALIEKGEMPRLIVDSGEIRAKLELSNLYEITEEQERPVATSGGGSRRPKKGGRGLRKFAKFQRAINLETNRATLLFDKNTGEKPPVRVAAKAASSSATKNADLCSEVIIRFKVV